MMMFDIASEIVIDIDIAAETDYMCIYIYIQYISTCIIYVHMGPSLQTR